MRRIKELYANLTKRTLLIPAMAGIVFVALRTYLSFVFAVVTMSILLSLIFCVCGKKGKQLLSFVLTFIVCLILGAYFAIYIPHEDFTYTNVYAECKVHSVRHTLDGNYKIRAYSYQYGFLEFSLSEGYVPQAGEEILIQGAFYEPYTPRNPGQFDQKSYLKRRGVEYAVKADKITSIRETNLLNRCISYSDNVLYGLRSKIMLLYGEDAPLAASVFMGDSSLAEDDLRTLYKRNGCSHLLAVSGTHFAGFLALITYMLNKGKKQRYKALIYIFSCLVLASFTGWSSSVTRACVMCCASYCSKDSLSGLCIASLIMTVADPYNALSYGFLMTCSASLGIMYITPILRKKADKVIGKELSGVLAPVIASQAGMLPFIVITSQKYGIIPLFVQLITSFIASLACSYFVPSVLLALIFGEVLILPSRSLLELLDLTIRTSDKYYFGFSLTGYVVVAILICILVILFRSSSFAEFMRLPAVILLILSILSGMLDVIGAPEAKVVFIDVGQGDSCLIMSSGKSILIDGGTFDAGKEDVAAVLDHYDIRNVDIAIATHWDRDHLGGLLYLYSCGYIDKIYTSCVDNGPKQLEIMNEYLPDADIEDIFLQLSEGDKVAVSEDCILNVLYPRADSIHTGENEDSLVIDLKCFDITVLLTGDLGIEQEEELILTEQLGKTDILKAGHHGSGFSTGYGLLRETSPDIAVISAGVNNQYGHPSKETLQRLEGSDVTVVSTQDMGAITVLIYKDKYEIFGFLRNHDILC